jgi:hypothetical protein
LTKYYQKLGKLRQEDGEFKPSLGYLVRPCLKKKKRCYHKLEAECHKLLLRESKEMEEYILVA